MFRGKNIASDAEYEGLSWRAQSRGPLMAPENGDPSATSECKESLETAFGSEELPRRKAGGTVFRQVQVGLVSIVVARCRLGSWARPASPIMAWAVVGGLSVLSGSAGRCRATPPGAVLACGRKYITSPQDTGQYSEVTSREGSSAGLVEGGLDRLRNLMMNFKLKMG